MYNSIYPVNINYRKPNPYQFQGDSNTSDKGNEQPKFQSPQKDTYIPSSNRINISQILMDFRNTILAINAPHDVQDEVNTYLNLVDKESKKEIPSRDIIFSNLKNASRISDDFIASALGKQSNVVEGWISTIFRQNINLKSNPDEINPDFLLKFPQKSQQSQPVQNEPVQEIIQPEVQEISENEDIKQTDTLSEIKITDVTPAVSAKSEALEIESSFEPANENQNIFNTVHTEPKKTLFSPNNENDKKAKVLYVQARKSMSADNRESLKDALNMLNEALGYLDEKSNSNIKAAIHFERGRIFDDYDYVDYALRDYFEATKADDLNLKANAFYKSGSIYDEFKEFDPALANYLSSVAYSGEADNLSAQSKVLSKISTMYARKFDTQNAHDYADLAIDAAVDSKEPDAIANTYSSIAQNYQYLGDSKNALEHYKNALEQYSRTNESYEEMAYNYSQASIVMRDLGNYAKAEKLQRRANLYYQKAQLQQDSQALAS